MVNVKRYLLPQAANILTGLKWQRALSVRDIKTLREARSSELSHCRSPKERKWCTRARIVENVFVFFIVHFRHEIPA